MWLIKDRRGSSALESSLSLAVVMLLLLGVFDLGRAIYAYTDISQVAREVARYAVMNPEDLAGARSVAAAYTTLDLRPADDVDVVFNHGTPFGTVQVTVTYHYHAISLLVAQFVGVDNDIALVSRSTMLLE
jgi:Flp pilus assembly protein TadG